MVSYKARIFLITFSCYVGVHSLRTTYSFSKGLIAQTVHVDDAQLGIVDSLMLYALALGFLQQTLIPFPRPVLALAIGLLLTSIFFILIPILLTAFVQQSFAILCVLMCFDGYFQSYAWPNLLMLVNSQFDNKQEALLLGFWSTNTNFGNILGFLICQLLVIHKGLPWQAAMAIIGIFVAANSLLVFIAVKELPKTDPLPIKDNESLISEEREEREVREEREEREKRESHKQERSLENIGKLFKNPVVILMTITFSLIKSIEYGILLWLPMYFNLVGLVDYSAYIPITFDCASIVSSVFLGFAFKYVENKGILLGPLILVLMVLFYLLRYSNATVSGYYVMITGVGLCLGGSYNTLAGLVAMELVKVVDPRFRTKYLGFYSAVLMCAANLITATTQILLGYVIGKDEEKIFTIFFWYLALTLLLLIAIAFLEGIGLSKEGKQREGSLKDGSNSACYIQIIQTH